MARALTGHKVPENADFIKNYIPFKVNVTNFTFPVEQPFPDLSQLSQIGNWIVSSVGSSAG